MAYKWRLLATYKSTDDPSATTKGESVWSELDFLGEEFGESIWIAIAVGLMR